MAIASINPATGETLRTFEAHSPADVERRVARAAELFPRWRTTSFAERAARMTRAAEVLDSRKAEWAKSLRACRHTNIAAVALAAKHARIAWAILAHGTEYRPAGPEAVAA